MATNIDETTATTKLTDLKLTDLNIDSVERIFTFLSLEDLLNVADTSTQLQSAVNLVYHFRYFGEKSQKIYLGITATSVQDDPP